MVAEPGVGATGRKQLRQYVRTEPGYGLRRKWPALTLSLSHSGEGTQRRPPAPPNPSGDAASVSCDHPRVTTEPRRFARALRRTQTSAEEALWQQLRGRRLDGSKWRRQVTLGPYTVDFLCLAAKLVVEVDGVQHAEAPLYDAARTREIEAQGFTVLRFTNRQVRERLDDVLTRISLALREASGD